MQTKYSRRWIIKAAGLLCLSGAVGVRISDWGALLTDPLVRRLTGFLKEAKSAKVIGQLYLDTVPEENNPDIILRRITLCYPKMISKLRTANKSDAKALIVNMITEDFRTEKTVQLNGWILSTTEVRLCALTSLIG